MITTQEKIKTTEEEFDSANRPQRLTISEQLEKDRRTNQSTAAKYSPDSETFEEVEL